MRVASASQFSWGTDGQCRVQDVTYPCHGGCGARLQHHSHDRYRRLGSTSPKICLKHAVCHTSARLLMRMNSASVDWSIPKRVAWFHSYCFSSCANISQPAARSARNGCHIRIQSWWWFKWGRIRPQKWGKIVSETSKFIKWPDLIINSKRDQKRTYTKLETDYLNRVSSAIVRPLQFVVTTFGITICVSPFELSSFWPIFWLD